MFLDSETLSARPFRANCGLWLSNRGLFDALIIFVIFVDLFRKSLVYQLLATYIIPFPEE